ncbi:ABC transporter substrate-binding protein [Micromonospora rifamycinica]|uniref:Iron complex transport system substrate-binding protein n=1 Tax=Micromonospora rifamycinica TaxID=291594 RepID=A0A109ILH8_9ACTN|nr:ABC transporter substrate-binding protein [Micromonospora rifamycinica]KWV32733.1 ABC transporter substrate-binding protein [Micromonospora rifamycinica]SCG44395.1 iron complex transport system substrate-binding protein [Micromonospora rifamycinica]
MLPSSSSPRFSRRGLLAAGGGAALTALLAACGGGDDPAKPTANGSAGPWSFTDDRQRKVEAASTPTRVVAFTGVAAALVDFGLDSQLVGVFGETTRTDGSRDPQAGDLDVDRVTVLGNVWGEFNVEKYAGLRPDLLVTHMYDPDALWYVPDESRDKILQLAPSVAVTTARTPMTRPIERYAELARSLGADLSAAKVTAARTRFEAAAEQVRAAVKANPGIRVMASSGSPDLFYVSNPKVSTDLMYFAELGVEIVVPTKLEAGDYFEALSWENAGKFPADLILLDNRSTALQPKDLAAKPTWAQLPAVRANQVTPWDAVPRFSYAGAAPLLENLATAIRSAKRLG